MLTSLLILTIGFVAGVAVTVLIGVGLYKIIEAEDDFDTSLSLRSRGFVRPQPAAPSRIEIGVYPIGRLEADLEPPSSVGSGDAVRPSQAAAGRSPHIQDSFGMQPYDPFDSWPHRDRTVSGGGSGQGRPLLEPRPYDPPRPK